MSQNYLNYDLEGTPLGNRKAVGLKDAGAELVYIWDPKTGFIDPSNPLNQNVEVHDTMDKVPEGKLLVVMAINGAFDAACCLADPWEFKDHWKKERCEWRAKNDPRNYMYYLVDADDAKKMYSPSGEDWDYVEESGKSSV